MYSIVLHCPTEPSYKGIIEDKFKGLTIVANNGLNKCLSGFMNSANN